MVKRTMLLAAFALLIIGAIYNFYPEPELPANASIDFILVKKSKNQLFAYSNGKILKTYQVSFGDSPVGHKEFEGDEKTPEGIYTIDTKNDKSGYHKNLGVSYPNLQDIAHAKTLGKSPGGEIKLHGIRNGIGIINKFQRFKNWTNGCIALTNNEIDELYAAVKIGTTIEIRP